MFDHFKTRNEQLIEFRIREEKAKLKKREFEVKTIHHKYYRITICRLKVILIEQIDQFSVDENSWYVRGVVDPTNLDKFKLTVKNL